MLFKAVRRTTHKIHIDLDALKQQVFRRRGRAGARGARVERLERRTLLSASDLDATFSGDGRLLADLPGHREGASSVAVQSDGKIVIGGVADGLGYANRDGVVLRYNTNGTLDTTFGTGGVVRFDLVREETVADVAIQSDGKIVIGGTRYGGNSYFIARLNASGTLDTSFGGGDGVMTGAGSLQYLSLQSGKIVTAADDVVRRHTSAGAIDTTFATGGSFSVTGGTDLESFDLGDMELDHAGRILLLGESASSSDSANPIVRLTPNGQVDASFGGGGGYVWYSGGSFNFVDALAVQPDNKIVLVINDEGYAETARLNVNGTPDAGYTSTGLIWSNQEYEGLLDAVTQPDGKVVVVGYGEVGYPDFSELVHAVAARVNVNGGLDTSFSLNGQTDFTFDPSHRDGDFDSARAVAIAPGGQIVLAGIATRSADFQTNTPHSDYIAVARMPANPAGANQQVQLAGGTLNITGTPDHDRILVQIAGAELEVIFDRSDRVRVPLAGVTGINVALGDGNDFIDLSVLSIPVTVDGGLGNDNVWAGAGNDLLIGGGGARDGLQGNGGNDTLIGGDSDDDLSGGDGNDSINAAGGDDNARGWAGNDTIFAGTGRDTVFGDDGNDSLDGGADDDVMDGGAGTDTLAGGAGDDIQINAENAGGNTSHITLAPDGTLTANGTLGDDLLVVERDHDSGTIYAYLNGVQVFFAPASVMRVSLFGSSGNDSMWVNDQLTMPATLLGGAGNDTLEAGGGPTALRGGDDNDILIGDTSADFLHGDAGHDSLFGEAGNDTLLGGDGDDLLAGGDGIDGLDGQIGDDIQLNGEGAGGTVHPITLGSGGVLHVPGRDTTDEMIEISAGSDGTVIVTYGARWFVEQRATVSFTGVSSILATPGAGNDRVDASLSALTVTLNGGAGNDELRAGNGNDRLLGADGDDTLVGGWGADTMIGGAGGDGMSGGDGGGNDTADYSDRTESLTLTAGFGSGLFDDGAAGEGDRLEGDIERILGGSGNDLITSESFDEDGRDNVLFGNGGNDTLAGGPGGDAMFGGSGDDLIDAGYLDYAQADYVEGNAGNDLILTRGAGDTVKGGDGNDTLEAAGAGDVTFEGGTRPIDTDTINVVAGHLTLPTDAGAQTAHLAITVGEAARATFNSTQHVDSLTLDPGAIATMTANGNRFLYTKHLQVQGRLDLTDNDLIVDYAAGESSPEFALRDLVKAIVDGGTSGIAFDPGAGDVTIAVAEQSEWGQTSFNGVAIDGTTVIGKYTFYGDANLDGRVTSDDYVAVDVGLGVGDSWVQGDFNFSGTVTSDDYVAIDVNLGKGSSQPLATEEPADGTLVSGESDVVEVPTKGPAKKPKPSGGTGRGR